MANYAPAIAPIERQEADEAVARKAAALAELIRKSKHMIVFTGAGISTSAGVPDFRGPEGTWTLMAQNRASSRNVTDTLQAIPTPTHMALVELQNRGILKYVVSQNCDGLHRRSGILPDKISELHGNSNREYCKDCGKEYIRDFHATAPYHASVHDHRTGRKCALCKGTLLDSIINFGEDLPEDSLRLAEQHARRADLCLALGSSLTVHPACDIPEAVGHSRGGKLVVCNLQDTPMDALCSLRVHGRADDLMGRVMAELGLPTPLFVLRRRLLVRVEAGARLCVAGEDVDGTPSSFLRSVSWPEHRRVVRSEPFVISLAGREVGAAVRLQLEFMGNYGEPNLDITYEYREEEAGKATCYELEYHHTTGEWKVSLRETAPPVRRSRRS